MKNFIRTLVAWGPFGVLILAALDSVGIPLPGGVDALLVTIAVVDPGKAYLAAAAAVVGSLLGSMILFFIARKGEEAYLARHTTHAKGARLKAWFMEYGLVTVFVPALVVIPLPMKVFVLCAGALGVNPWAFLAVLAVARIVRYFSLAWLGMRLGNETLPYLRHHLPELVAFSVLLFAALVLLVRVLDRRHRLAHLTESE